MVKKKLSAATVYWFTGLSNVGKSTIAKAFHDKLKKKCLNVVFLDGDVLREVFNTRDNSYKLEDRLQIAYRNAQLCKLLADQGVTVICATISLFHQIHDWNRQNFHNYYEIFIHAPLDVLRQRDCKGVYRTGSANIVGIDIQPEYPVAPDLSIENLGDKSPEAIADMIYNALSLSKLKINLNITEVSCE